MPLKDGNRFSIPSDALGFGAESNYPSRASYGKSRVSGSNLFSYILHSKAGCMPGRRELFTKNPLTSPEMLDPLLNNPIVRSFILRNDSQLRPTIGEKYNQASIESFTYQEYAPHDDESLELAKKACYRQVFGNLHLMDSERPIDLERRLRNGDLTIREFIRGLAKSPFYRSHYFEYVNQQRSIELNIKHLLGRPPLSQAEIVTHIKILIDEGFDQHIDSLIDSKEYKDVFGEDMVPFQRCWDSPCGAKTSSFNKTAALMRSYATSDNAIHERKTCTGATGGKSQLLEELAKEHYQAIIIPDNVELRKSSNHQIKAKTI